MIYIKKPLRVEAFQYGIDNMPDWFFDEVCNNNIILRNKKEIVSPFQHEYETMYCEIKTLEGTMIAKYGDYIVKGINDEIYPVKEDIFKKTYIKEINNLLLSTEITTEYEEKLNKMIERQLFDYFADIKNIKD